MRKTRLPFVVLIGTLLSAAVAPPLLDASTWRGTELLGLVKDAPWKLGPFRLRPAVVLSNVGYDSNLYSLPDPVKDFTLTFGPAVTAYVPIKRTLILSVYESPRYVYFLETANERAWNNYFRTEASLVLNRFFIQAGVFHDNARERWNFEIDVRPRRRATGVQGTFLWQVSKKVSLNAGLSRTAYRYEGLEFLSLRLDEQLNRDDTSADAGLAYRLSPRVQAFVDFEAGKADFISPDNFRDSRSRAAHAGFEFSPTGRIRGRVRIGYKDLDSVRAGVPDFNGLVGDTGVSLRALRTVVLRASYKRDIEYSIWFDSSFYVGTSAGGGASIYVMRRKVRLDYDYNRIRNAYAAAAGAAGGGTEERIDRLNLHTVGAYFRVSKSAALGVTAGRMDREINVYGWTARREYVGLNLTYDF